MRMSLDRPQRSSMDPLNVLGVETPRGYRTFELFHGDLTTLQEPVDVLVVSAFAGSYVPTPGTLAGALSRRLGIDLVALSYRPELDLRTPLGTWVSCQLQHGPFKRIICAELIGSGLPVPEVLSNVFVSLSILEARGLVIRSVALPVLGAGAQGLAPKVVIEALLTEATNYLQRSTTTKCIKFVELNERLARDLAAAMDVVLGRVRTYLPQDALLRAVQTDIRHKLQQVKTLFDAGGDSLQASWLGLLQADRVPSVELGVQARRLVELMVSRMGAHSDAPLYKRIHALEGAGVAPWVCGYMHVLRHIGNESAHENPSASRRPPTVEARDLALCLFCVERLLDYWMHHHDPNAAV